MVDAASPFVIVLTTFPADGDAEMVARKLVEERLVACVNILPVMNSVYRWEGKIDQSRERQVVMKTAQDQVDELKRRLEELHPFEVPELLVVPVSDGGDRYLAWIRESVGPQI
jgi:periplasmic divalent cation tolerance protein